MPNRLSDFAFTSGVMLNDPLMPNGLAALEMTEWSRLQHAYGRATDTPKHLRALLEKDAEARKEAIFHLWSAVIHQGTPWTATAPAAAVVAGLLSDEHIDRGDRANLLSFLVSVAEVAAQPDPADELALQAVVDIESLPGEDNEEEAIYQSDEEMDACYARAILGCIQVAPLLLTTMLRELDDSNAAVRMRAAMSAVVLMKVNSLGNRTEEIKSRLLSMAQATHNSDERGALLLSLGELGFSPIDYLADPSGAVRMCAALAPGLAENPAAIDVLIEILQQHAGSIEEWFMENPPQFAMHPRFAVVRRLLEQVRDFERLAGAAVAVLEVTAKYSVDFDWGPLLAAAFPEGNGKLSTHARCRFLSTLVEKEEFWDPNFGNALKWFQMAGLPYNRHECALRVSSGLN
ncbi:MAG: hypothetical protein JWL90_2403 [Chthoniobacteraceae bacterium]|nr:hypothetical protein [Chthoniobacteraceae bacterium]